MNATVSANELPNAMYYPEAAAEWLLTRHLSALHIAQRCRAWENSMLPNLTTVAQGIKEADRYGVEWEKYQDENPAPNHRSFEDERRYERHYEAWEQAGPKTTDPVALAYLPMSSGEKRVLRMLAVLAPAPRVQFTLGDTAGISLQCCTEHDHRPFVADWADLMGSGAR